MTDGEKYTFRYTINNPIISSPRYKMFTSKEEMLGSLIISIYDTPQNKPLLQNNPKTFNNGIIDVNEFNDTKEEYEKNIEKIKQYCKTYGQDISDIKLPTYQEMVKLCDKNVDIDTITSFLRPKKSLEEEIGLGDLEYKIEVKDCNQEVRKYKNNAIVTIYYNGNEQYEDIEIENDNKGILKRFNSSTGTIKQQVNDDFENGIMTTTNYYTNGNIQEVKIEDLDRKVILEQNNYDKYGKRILNDNQKLAHELIKDLNHTNFIGRISVRSSLQENLNKITTENIEQVLREYKKATGKSLIQAIEHARNSIDSIDSIDSFFERHSTTDEMKDRIRKCLIQKYPQDKKIKDMSSFFEETDIDNELKNIFEENIFEDYNRVRMWWSIYTDRNSFESDILNSNLPPKIKAEYSRLIWKEARSRLNIKPNLKIENSQIKNDYYTSDMVYDVQYNINTDWFGGTITIINKTTGITRVIDVNKMTQYMSPINCCEFLTNIQKHPAEILEGAAIEIGKIYGCSGKEFELQKNNSGGFYVPWEESIVNDTEEGIDVHELGHAIDYNYILGQCKNSSAYGSFYSTYTNERDEYIRKGNTCATGSTSYTNPKDGLINYCTTNECEMFAECYALLMTGNCNSKETILMHFRKTLNEAEKLLKEIRKLPDDVRLKKHSSC